MEMRALNQGQQVALVAILTEMREHYRDRAIEGPIDSGLGIGFARGLDHVLKLIREAPRLADEIARQS